jgi:hypothetical protein
MVDGLHLPSMHELPLLLNNALERLLMMQIFVVCAHPVTINRLARWTSLTGTPAHQHSSRCEKTVRQADVAPFLPWPGHTTLIYNKDTTHLLHDAG